MGSQGGPPQRPAAVQLDPPPRSALEHLPSSRSIGGMSSTRKSWWERLDDGSLTIPAHNRAG